VHMYGVGDTEQNQTMIDSPHMHCPVQRSSFALDERMTLFVLTYLLADSLVN
jgi:hypothetical protein